MKISLFSGQGAQYPGMGKDISEAYPNSAKIYDIASDVLERDMRAICFESEEKELSRTINAQPAVMLTSLVALRAALEKGYKFDGVAGHSLGEYAALVASGMISEKEAFLLIKSRAEAMEVNTTETKGAMAVVIKLNSKKVKEICACASNYVTAVNFNSPLQTVIAGTQEGIEEALEKFADLKVRTKLLNVTGAFHSKLMQSAAKKFYETAKNFTFKTPNVKYYSNLTGRELTDFSDMPTLLAKHMVSPVRFTSELAAMQEDGADTFVEFGPGKVITNLVKRTLNDNIIALNIENLETLEGAEIYGIYE